MVTCKLTLEAAGGKEWAKLLRLENDERACVAASLFAHCAEGVVNKGGRLKASGEVYDRVAETARKRVRDTATRMREALCTEKLSDAVRGAVRAITNRWSQEHER